MRQKATISANKALKEFDALMERNCGEGRQLIYIRSVLRMRFVASGFHLRILLTNLFLSIKIKSINYFKIIND